MKILFIDKPHEILKTFLENAGHEVVEGYNLDRRQILERIKDYQGLVIRSRIALDKEFIDAGSSLKFIARSGAGMESIDTDYAQSKNIACINSPEGNMDAVAEHALGCLLSLLNNLSKADREVRAGKWIREENRGTELGSLSVGIIGYGNMGSAFAGKLSGIGCRILVYDKYKSGFGSTNVIETDLQTIQNECEVLSLHTPLTAETEFMINASFLEKFKKKLWFINTARGRCVRTNDLVRALKTGRVAGAALDVFEYEDSSFEKFSLDNESLQKNPDWQYLVSAPNVILTPHIAGWSHQSSRKNAQILADKILRFFQ
ncbi:MAG: hydroxyacid dehydrogenase [Bacteroidetes bacterium]|nr:MAG: hydroxyacid dehydrogenase [Bacteroidota bacterium]REK04949.1 MAG: hydroxyacid dehydrogenase [Bacteroidota bacterium]REK36547.1 MAG: hydroxyacid dehydrogenase [Bacteroidota bacterium]REK50913.1 MAG: hydroxyacid dehydrogenase [Bacteroidota bacterium]